MRQFTSDGYWTAMLRGGLSKVFLLQAMREGPGHGYELARRVEIVSRGFCMPTQGTIYPALREFERDGCASSHAETVRGRRRKVYALTRKGRQALRAALAAWQEGQAVIRRALTRTP